MPEHEIFRKDIDPRKLKSSHSRFKVPVNSDPFLKFCLSYFSRYGELIPRVLYGAMIRVTVYIPDSLTDAQKAQKISKDAWARLEALENRRKPLPE